MCGCGWVWVCVCVCLSVCVCVCECVRVCVCVCMYVSVTDIHTHIYPSLTYTNPSTFTCPIYLYVVVCSNSSSPHGARLLHSRPSCVLRGLRWLMPRRRVIHHVECTRRGENLLMLTVKANKTKHNILSKILPQGKIWELCIGGMYSTVRLVINPQWPPTRRVGIKNERYSV